MIIPAFFSALDCLKTPNHSSSLVLSTICQGLGTNIEYFSISRETLRCAHIENWEEIAKELFQNSIHRSR